MAVTSEETLGTQEIIHALKVRAIHVRWEIGSMTNSNVLFENPRARRAQIAFNVKINNTDTIIKIARWEVREQARIAGFASNVDIPSEEQMIKYMKNLLWLRVSLANGERVDHDVKVMLKRFYIPARWYVMLDHIGEAHDARRNIKFFPTYAIDASDTLTAEQMVEISEMLAVLKPEGYTCVAGIPTHAEGSIEFMAKVALAEGNALDTIRGMDVHNPVFGFFAEVFKLEVLGLTYKELDMMYRVEYSSGDVYAGQFYDYYRSVSANAANNQQQTNIPTNPEPGASNQL